VGKTALELVEEAKGAIDVVTPGELAEEIAAGDVLLVDVRDSQERELGYIPGSIHVPRVALEFAADPTSPAADVRLDPKRRVVLHCGLGLGSALATARLLEMGYEAPASLEGGYEAWVDAGYRVEYPASTRNRLLG
jgi:rhodanese-related sulfurtransferase